MGTQTIPQELSSSEIKTETQQLFAKLGKIHKSQDYPKQSNYRYRAQKTQSGLEIVVGKDSIDERRLLTMSSQLPEGIKLEEQKGKCEEPDVTSYSITLPEGFLATVFPGQFFIYTEEQKRIIDEIYALNLPLLFFAQKINKFFDKDKAELNMFKCILNQDDSIGKFSTHVLKSTGYREILTKKEGMGKVILSLDRQFGEEGESVIDTIPDFNSTTPLDRLIDQESKEIGREEHKKVFKLICERFDERTAEILLERFQGYTFREIGAFIGITGSRVQQIYSVAVQELEIIIINERIRSFSTTESNAIASPPDVEDTGVVEYLHLPKAKIIELKIASEFGDGVAQRRVQSICPTSRTHYEDAITSLTTRQYFIEYPELHSKAMSELYKNHRPLFELLSSVEQDTGKRIMLRANFFRGYRFGIEYYEAHPELHNLSIERLKERDPKLYWRISQEGELSNIRISQFHREKVKGK